MFFLGGGVVSYNIHYDGNWTLTNWLVFVWEFLDHKYLSGKYANTWANTGQLRLEKVQITVVQFFVEADSSSRLMLPAHILAHLPNVSAAGVNSAERCKSKAGLLTEPFSTCAFSIRWQNGTRPRVIDFSRNAFCCPVNLTTSWRSVGFMDVLLHLVWPQVNNRRETINSWGSSSMTVTFVDLGVVF